MDSLKDFLYTVESCNHCGQCRFILGPKMRGWDYAQICPINLKYKFDAHSGQGLLNIAQEILEGQLPWTDGLLEHIYTCTTCGACDINCKSVRDMEVMDTILALRAKCVEDGRGPLPAHRGYALHVESTHNIYGQPHMKRFDWLEERGIVSKQSQVAYFTGCTTAYFHPETARNTMKILESGGLNFKVLGDAEFCCGGPLWRTGQWEAARKVMTQNLETFRNQGIRTIITSCAECYGTFKNGYPRFTEMDVEILHITEVMERLLEKGTLNLSKACDLSITYHDPCMLGRLSEKYIPWAGQVKAFGLLEPPKQWRRGTNGIYDAPRKVLKAIPGIRLVEMTRNEENSFCCGAGGGVADAFPEFASSTAIERLNEARSTGADAVVSSCPFCQTNFENSLSGTKSKMAYYDLTDLVAQAL